MAELLGNSSARAALAEQAAAVTAGLSDIEDAERAGELLSLTLREDTSREAVLVTRRRDVIRYISAVDSDRLSARTSPRRRPTQLRQASPRRRRPAARPRSSSSRAPRRSSRRAAPAIRTEGLS